MEKENRELKKQIESLKSELEASMRREDMLLHPHRGRDYVKQKIKNTVIGKAAMNPDSMSGKLIRLPRTAYRIIRHPGIVKDIKNKNSKSDGGTYKTGKIEDILVPVKFFVGVSAPRRVNLLVEKIDEEALRMAIELANKEKNELRVITYGEGAGSIKYAKLLKEKKIPKAEKIDFYSSVDQMQKNEVFELEIGENDIFLTKAWKGNEKSNKDK